jgi:hypothetical protein
MTKELQGRLVVGRLVVGRFCQQISVPKVFVEDKRGREIKGAHDPRY